MSAGPDDPDQGFASPACSLSEVEAAYAGYWTADEVRAFLARLVATDAAAAAFLGGYADRAAAARPFSDRETAVRELRQALPRIRDDALHAELTRLADRWQGR